ncbi:MAG TPA: S9 family peptidase [Ktedonobacteraceae bacterium]|nr:S9 family peptidase [Ktedonobacteraceae bacterium]
MTKPQVAPYGSWKSPITSDLIVSATIGLGPIVLDESGGSDIYWTELRPSEGGRNVLVRRTADGQISDITPPPFNVRTRVHEYGGTCYAINEGTVYFSNFAEQRVYRLSPGSEPQPITPAEDLRYADGRIDRQRNRMIWVREDHTVAGREAVNTLVSFGLDGNDETILVSGNDFYSTPRLSPDGTRLAWLTWNHPNMPWDGTELWLGEIGVDGSLSSCKQVAGGKEESIFQPEWSPGGVLHFISDRTGWWNLYRWNDDGSTTALCPMEAEFGLPQWGLGMSTFTFASSDQIICSYIQQGICYLAELDTSTGALEQIETPYTTIGGPLAGPSGRVFFRGGSPTEALSLVQLDLNTGKIEIIRRSSEIKVDSAYISVPEPIEFPTEGGLTAYAFFYPPRNRDYGAPEGELPPVLVQSHGGPTTATNDMLNLGTQYWTSRGIAVLDVNYGGSTGYGREYRERLAGQWGIVDVDDCVNGAKYLAEQGKVDGNRLMIAGGSAGGYTTLCALTFRDVFKAGASYFGVSDMEALVKDTHKFESRYEVKLVGPFPERRDIYQQRSPIHFTERISCPVIFFQGLEDKIVPPNQAEVMVNSLRAKGLPVAYLAFEGEQHGFRRAENIKRSLDAELYFYSRVFGFPLADPVEPVQIENL